MAAENDVVIPPGVIQRLYDAAVKAQRRDLCVALGASHFVFTDLRAQHPDYLDYLLGLVTDMLSADAH